MLVFKQVYPDAQAFIEQFLDPNCQRPKYVFGTNHEAEQISQLVALTGFVEDLKPLNRFAGLPVITSEQLPTDALVVIVALMRPLSIHQKLAEQQIWHIHSMALLRFSNLPLSTPWFWQGFVEDFASHPLFYQTFDEVLADSVSVSVFQQLMQFRLTGNLDDLQGFSDRQAEQYFEPFLKLSPGEVFVDVGGFDGETALNFVQRCPDYEAIHLFEPEQANLQIAKQACQNVSKLHFHQLGLSNRTDTLGILARASTSKLVAKGQGDYDIRLAKLDDVLENQKVTLIKMDIEGAEFEALQGAQQLITIQRPKLALCVYHHGADLRRIYQLVQPWLPNSKVYLRHYTEGIVETVLFFIPNRVE